MHQGGKDQACVKIDREDMIYKRGTVKRSKNDYNMYATKHSGVVGTVDCMDWKTEGVKWVYILTAVGMEAYVMEARKREKYNVLGSGLAWKDVYTVLISLHV